jgi:leucyl aminopeptidase
VLKVRLHAAPPGDDSALALFLRQGAPPPAALRAGAAAARFTGAAGQVARLWDGHRAVLLAGLGTTPDTAAATRAGGLAAAALADQAQAAFDARDLSPALAAALAEGAALRTHTVTKYRTRPDPDSPAPRLARLDLHVAALDPAQAAWRRGFAAARGSIFARELATDPANVLTPKNFAARLAELPGMEITVLRPAEIAKAGMGALLGVARASANAPRVAVLRRKGAFKAKPLVLLGKGVCFDTGGISIKPALNMEAMKADMAGAAACAGAMLALALRDSPAPVVAVLGLVENAIGDNAQRPGDVVQAADGSSIEIVDTDAEGRLVLADLLAWSRARLDPVAMIDLATLTGSIVTALGHHRAGLYATDAALATKLAAAGEATGELLWPMPISQGIDAEALESAIADIRHCAHGRLLPDANQAAAFLKRFVADVPWAHLDIAGVEWRDEADPLGAAGATGFGARLLDRLVAQSFEDPDRWPEQGH